jgi:type I restriction enzyme R subunit
MEHAIRKHCTIHFDEDPEFYRRMSEKLDRLIQQYGNNWILLAKSFSSLRNEVVSGRSKTVEGLAVAATPFHAHVVFLAYGDGEVPDGDQVPLKELMNRMVGMLRETIKVLDFWRKPIEVKKLRGDIDTEILLADIPALRAKHQRLAVEIVKLAEKRHEELTK